MIAESPAIEAPSLFARAVVEAEARASAARADYHAETVEQFALKLAEVLGVGVDSSGIMVLPRPKDDRFEPRAIFVVGRLRFAYHNWDDPLRVQYCCARCLVMANERGRTCRTVADIGDEIKAHCCPDRQP